jgi:hypothetical protein
VVSLIVAVAGVVAVVTVVAVTGSGSGRPAGGRATVVGAGTGPTVSAASTTAATLLVTTRGTVGTTAPTATSSPPPVSATPTSTTVISLASNQKLIQALLSTPFPLPGQHAFGLVAGTPAGEAVPAAGVPQGTIETVQVQFAYQTGTSATFRNARTAEVEFVVFDQAEDAQRAYEDHAAAERRADRSNYQPIDETGSATEPASCDASTSDCGAVDGNVLILATRYRGTVVYQTVPGQPAMVDGHHGYDVTVALLQDGRQEVATARKAVGASS